MKKLLTSLATITLIGGSVANVAAFKQISHQPNINNLTPKVINRTAANEDAEDIAGKLFHKTIKLDPNVWLGKNLATDQANFNAFLVKLGILSSAEAQYVTWGNLNINVAGWYWSKADFTVKKDGATATGNVTLNASTGETTAQIAAKLNKETLKFNYDWWNGKDVAANWAQIPQMLANEHLLTRAEASVVIGVSFGDFTVTKTGQPYYIMGFDVNDNNTVSNATPTINVVNDGPSAATRASEVTGTYYLKGNLNGQYADTTAAETDLTNYLEHDNLDLFKGINVILPHVKLNGDTRINDAIIVKDGQAAKTPWFMVDTENKPQILTQNLTTSHFNALVTLTPPVIQALKKDFTAYPSYNSILSSFYQTLDDNQDPDLGSVGTNFFGTKLTDLTGKTYAQDEHGGDEKPNKIVVYQCNASDAGDLAFAKALSNEIKNISATSYLTLDFTWYYAWGWGNNTYTSEYWGFW